MATRETVAAQVHTLHKEVREMHDMLRLIADRIGLEAAPPARHEVREDGAVFLPGTGWTGVHTDPDDGEQVDQAAGLQNVRDIRSKLKRPS
jgi:hypothetical protein